MLFRNSLMNGKMSSNARGCTTARLRMDSTGFQGKDLRCAEGFICPTSSTSQIVVLLLLADNPTPSGLRSSPIPTSLASSSSAVRSSQSLVVTIVCTSFRRLMAPRSGIYHRPAPWPEENIDLPNARSTSSSLSTGATSIIWRRSAAELHCV